VIAAILASAALPIMLRSIDYDYVL